MNSTHTHNSSMMRPHPSDISIKIRKSLNRCYNLDLDLRCTNQSVNPQLSLRFFNDRCFAYCRTPFKALHFATSLSMEKFLYRHLSQSDFMTICDDKHRRDRSSDLSDFEDTPTHDIISSLEDESSSTEHQCSVDYCGDLLNQTEGSSTPIDSDNDLSIPIDYPDTSSQYTNSHTTSDFNSVMENESHSIRHQSNPPTPPLVSNPDPTTIDQELTNTEFTQLVKSNIGNLPHTESLFDSPSQTNLSTTERVKPLSSKRTNQPFKPSDVLGSAHISDDLTNPIQPSSLRTTQNHNPELGLTQISDNFTDPTPKPFNIVMVFPDTAYSQPDCIQSTPHSLYPYNLSIFSSNLLNITKHITSVSYTNSPNWFTTNTSKPTSNDIILGRSLDTPDQLKVSCIHTKRRSLEFSNYIRFTNRLDGRISILFLALFNSSCYNKLFIVQEPNLTNYFGYPKKKRWKMIYISRTHADFFP